MDTRCQRVSFNSPQLGDRIPPTSRNNEIWCQACNFAIQNTSYAFRLILVSGRTMNPMLNSSQLCARRIIRAGDQHELQGCRSRIGRRVQRFVSGLPGCWSQGETEAEALENL